MKSEYTIQDVAATATILSIGSDYLVYRSGSGGTVEILDIEVNSERRVGIGRRLVTALLKEVPKECPTVYAITRIENEIAQQFYEALGFDRVAVIRRFYKDNPYPGKRSADAVMYGRSPEGPI